MTPVLVDRPPGLTPRQVLSGSASRAARPANAALRGAELLRSCDRSRTLYTVSVLPASAQQADAVPVIETRLWTDSVEMLAHLQAQQRDCVNGSSEAAVAEDAPAAAAS